VGRSTVCLNANDMRMLILVLSPAILTVLFLLCACAFALDMWKFMRWVEILRVLDDRFSVQN